MTTRARALSASRWLKTACGLACSPRGKLSLNSMRKQAGNILSILQGRCGRQDTAAGRSFAWLTFCWNRATRTLMSSRRGCPTAPSCSARIKVGVLMTCGGILLLARKSRGRRCRGNGNCAKTPNTPATTLISGVTAKPYALQSISGWRVLVTAGKQTLCRAYTPDTAPLPPILPTFKWIQSLNPYDTANRNTRNRSASAFPRAEGGGGVCGSHGDAE